MTPSSGGYANPANQQGNHNRARSRTATTMRIAKTRSKIRTQVSKIGNTRNRRIRIAILPSGPTTATPSIRKRTKQKVTSKRRVTILVTLGMAKVKLKLTSDTTTTVQIRNMDIMAKSVSSGESAAVR